MVLVQVERHIYSCFYLLRTSSTDLLHGAEEKEGLLKMRDMAEIKQLLS